MSCNFNNITVLEVDSPEEPRWQKGTLPDDYLMHCVNFKLGYAETAFQEQVAPSELVQHNLVVVADTVVEFRNSIFGKPTDAKDAFRILQTLSNQKHIVKTRVATLVFDKNKKKLDSVETLSTSFVKFKKLSSSDIHAYIKTKEPFDKAGAYGLQDNALKFVESVEGSYLNIIGFPLSDFLKSVKNYLI